MWAEGIVGLACALDLRRAGRTRLRSMSAQMGRVAASWGNAGHIAIEQVEPLASMKALKSAPPRAWFPRGGALDFDSATSALGPWARRLSRPFA
jgi:glycine/D-amino acid oxidase-like deaminating enzyme